MSLLTRLRERKLVQWALAYLAGAWVLLEATGFVSDRFAWPEVIVRALTILVGVGFFVTLVLAWYHGEKGRQTVSGPELLMLTALFVIAGVAISRVGPTDVREQTTDGGDPLRPGNSEDAKPSIAVLPLENRSGRQEDEYFTDGIHDEILTQLSRINGLSVRGRTSVLQYRDSPKNLRQIGEELKARYLLEGGVQRVRDTVRINVQLIDARADEHLWAEIYDRELAVENLLSVQSEIAQRIAESLNATLTLEELRQIAAAPTDNIEAYDYYLRSMATWGPEGIDMLERALQEDPQFMLPYARLAQIHVNRYVNRDPRRDFRAGLVSAFERAFAMDPDHPATYAARGFYVAGIQQDYEQALADFEIAVRAGILPREWLAYAEQALGNFEEAGALLGAQCETHDPRNAGVCEEAATTYIALRDYSEAERHNNRALALDPSYVGVGFDARMHAVDIVVRRDGDVAKGKLLLRAIPDSMVRNHPRLLSQWLLLDRLDRSHEDALNRLDSSPLTGVEMGGVSWPKPLLYAQVYALMGRTDTVALVSDSARAILEVRLATEPDDPRLHAPLHSALGLAYAGLGRKDDAIRHGKRAVELARGLSRRSHFLAELARTYVMVGESDAAIDQIEAVLAAPGELSVPLLRIDPIYDPLRDHPRFQALLDKYGSEH
jgi:serine/threonine-protein kinase